MDEFIAGCFVVAVSAAILFGIYRAITYEPPTPRYAEVSCTSWTGRELFRIKGYGLSIGNGIVRDADGSALFVGNFTNRCKFTPVADIDHAPH